jgi:hypothetical protein
LDVISRLAGDAQILTVFEDGREIPVYSAKVQELEVDHQAIDVLRERIDMRTRRWAKFVQNDKGVCLATQVWMQALPFGVKAFTVYRSVPTLTFFKKCTHPGPNLIFFTNDDQIWSLDADSELTVTTDE